MLTDYTIRLPNQFQDSTNLKALITIIYNKIKEIDDIYAYLLLNTISVAEGVWLDEIGDIVGVPRSSQMLTDAEIFAYCSLSDFPGDSALGYSDLANPQGGYFIGLDENGHPWAPTGISISDTDYRALINAKVLSTYSDDTINDIYNWILSTFSVESYVYNSNPCEIAVELEEYLTFYQRWVLLTYAPISAGVRIWIAYNPPYTPPPVVTTQLEDEEEDQP